MVVTGETGGLGCVGDVREGSDASVLMDVVVVVRNAPFFYIK